MEGGVYVSSLFNKDGHLTDEALALLKDGHANDDELITITEHIGYCMACAQTLLSSYDESTLAAAPSGFSEQIKSRLTIKKENTIQLWFYSLKVCAAVCAALLIVFSGTFNWAARSDALSSAVKAPSLGFVDSISSGLKDFSQMLVSMEGFKFENKKK